MMATLLSVWFAIMLAENRRRTAAGWTSAGPPQQPVTPTASGPGPLKPAPISLSDARRGFKTKLIPRNTPTQPLDQPPPGVFQIVHFPSAVGELAAYLSPDPRDQVKHPAIVWITGGDCNSIGDVWSDTDPKNDQTASAYREAGIVMMFPALRGGNANPGVKEGFFGELDDLLSAEDYLWRARAYVDPEQIYLGGHSTGGTLALLGAEFTDRFRAVFSFGPAARVDVYGQLDPSFVPFDLSNPQEVQLRSPGLWLPSIRCPTFVFEGTSQGNLEHLQVMSKASVNPLAHFHEVSGADHFSILAPTNQLIAGKILQDEGPATNITFTTNELNRPFGR